jgi:hypothetical protein
MSTISSGTTLTTALVQTGDTSGDLVIKTGSSNTTAMTISGSDQSVTIAGAVNVASTAFANGSAAAPSITFNGDTNTGIFSPAADTIAFTEGGVESMRITSAGNVGIGTTTINARLHVTEDNKIFDSYGNINVFSSTATATDAGGAIAFGGRNGQGTDPYVFGKIKGAKEAGGTWNGYLAFGTTAGSSAITERMRLDSSGNLGLGVTPSAWQSTFRALQIGSGTSLYNNASGNGTFLGSNFFWNGTNNLYLNSTTASAYGQASGQHQWFTAPTGTAGNAITFTQAMTLNASGNLGIGTTSPSRRLHVVDSGSFVATFQSSGTGVYTAWQASGGTVGYIGGAAGLGAGSATDFGVRAETNLIFMTNAGSERMRLDSSGNLGIGTSSPGASYKLDVSGNTRTTGYLSLNDFGYVRGSSGNLDLQCGTTGTRIMNSGYGVELMSVSDAGLLKFNSGFGYAGAAYGCRAWVNFNGTGTVAIRASGNVSSVSDNGTGRYTVNFTTSMPDVDYSAVFNCNGNSDSFGGGGRQFTMVRTRATGSVQVNTVDDGGAETDPSYIGVAVFR